MKKRVIFLLVGASLLLASCVNNEPTKKSNSDTSEPSVSESVSTASSQAPSSDSSVDVKSVQLPWI